MEPETGTSFIYKDAFNHIYHEKKQWEVAHPMIFHRLVSQQKQNTSQWRLVETNAPMLHGLYYTLLRVQTPLGLGTVWVFVEDPELFQFPETLEDRWDWWLQWGQHPILVSCPILTQPVAEGAPMVSSWTIRSTPFYQHNGSYALDPHDPLLFYPFYTQGCYTVASGQTVFLALHRCGQLDASTVLEILTQWDTHYRDMKAFKAPGDASEAQEGDASEAQEGDASEAQEGDASEAQEGDASDAEAEAPSPDAKWMIIFHYNTIQMIQHIQTNTLVGDQLPLYAIYGNTSPLILRFFLETADLLTPMVPHVLQEPPSLMLNYLPYYIPLLAKPSPHWADYWSILKPFLPAMSVARMRESPMYPKPVQVYPPSSINSPFWDSLIDLHGALGDIPAFAEYLHFLQDEFVMGNGRIAHRLLECSFQRERTRPIPKQRLYAFWSFVQRTFFAPPSGQAASGQAAPGQWMRFLGRFFEYYRQHTQVAIPWRFLHWLFFHSPTPPSLFQRLPGNLSLFHTLRLSTNLPSPNGVPALFRSRVLLPRIQGRLRVLYQFKRDLSPDLCDVFQAYLRKNQDLMWI